MKKKKFMKEEKFDCLNKETEKIKYTLQSANNELFFQAESKRNGSKWEYRINQDQFEKTSQHNDYKWDKYKTVFEGIFKVKIQHIKKKIISHKKNRNYKKNFKKMNKIHSQHQKDEK